MKKLTVAAMIVGSSRDSADLLYAARFNVHDPVVFLAVGRRRYLVVPKMELGRARRECPAIRVFTPADLNLRLAERQRLSGWALGLLQMVGIRRVTVAGTFPLGVARRLERRGVRIRVAQGALFASRQIKTPAEIEKLRAVQRATAAAMREAVALLARAHPAACGVLRIGSRVLTAEIVRTAISRKLLDYGCAGSEPIVACGEQAADPHCVGHGPLRAREPIVIDIFPQDLESGYCGDLTRTVVKGEPQPGIVAMYRAVRAARKAALAVLRGGVRAARVHAAAEAEFRRRGFRNETINNQSAGFIHGTGHGLGLEVHEPPSLSKNDQVLRAGNVVTVEPGLYYPGTGGVRIEDAVVVRKTGFEYLARCEETLVIR